MQYPCAKMSQSTELGRELAVDVKEAAKLAKEYVADLFADEGIDNVGLEEIELGDDRRFWEVTVGFSRPWDNRGLAAVTLGQTDLRRTYKVLRIDNASGNVASIRDRILLDCA